MLVQPRRFNEFMNGAFDRSPGVAPPRVLASATLSTCLRTRMRHWPPLSPSIYHRLSYGSAFGLSDVGLVRKSNRDSFLTSPRKRQPLTEGGENVNI